MVTAARQRLLFVSPQFLFPMDAGGKIRTANLLRNLKGGAFHLTLLTPAAPDSLRRWRDELHDIADDVRGWSPAPPGEAARALGLFGATPISAMAEASRAARSAFGSALEDIRPDLVVFDYAQSIASAADPIGAPSVLFAHNVETEILQRHSKASAGLRRLVWAREAAKMAHFERMAAKRVDAVVAVSERDAGAFLKMGARYAGAIPTGVDCDYFSFAPPGDDASPVVVFTGSLDWKANQDGLVWFMDEVWPAIASARADASFVVIGKNPPPPLAAAARKRGFNWRFTGFVDDVRPHARGAVYVIPLRVGGGTRIKAFEAMAMGLPVVSTPIGVEGLPVAAGEHYLSAQAPDAFAAAVVELLADGPRRRRLAASARRLVEEEFSHAVAARKFETHCLAVLAAAR